MIDGERPPKEPASAPNGVPYERLWNVASRCWVKEPGSRPAMDKVVVDLQGKGKGCLLIEAPGSPLGS